MTEDEKIARKTNYINSLSERRDYFEKCFYEQRNILLNFIGLMILGGFVLIFQNNIDLNGVKNTIISIYFISLIILILAKYLFLNDYRKWGISFSNSIKDNLKISDTSIVPYEFKHRDTISALAVILSVTLFFVGSFLGLYQIMKCSWQFIVSVIGFISVLIFVCKVEYDSKKSQEK